MSQTPRDTAGNIQVRRPRAGGLRAVVADLQGLLRAGYGPDLGFRLRLATFRQVYVAGNFVGNTL